MMTEYEQAVKLCGEEVAKRLAWHAEREELPLLKLAIHAVRIKQRAEIDSFEFKHWWQPR